MEGGAPQSSSAASKYAWRKKPRNFQSRSLSGCKTCKIRRVKCDERKPACNKCTSTGRICDGYSSASGPLNGSGSSSFQQPLFPVPASPSTLAVLRPALATGLQVPPVDGDVLCFFQRETLPQLIGYRDPGTWMKTLLQIARDDPSAYHASLALGVLHRAYCNPGLSASSSHRAAALTHYNLAIRHLTQPQHRPSPSAVLASCYLFTCLENLMGDPQRSLSHIRNGLKFLASHEDTSVDSDIPHQFSVLESQAAAWDPTWIPSRSAHERHSRTPRAAQSALSSLQGAQNEFDCLLADTMHLRRPEVSAQPGSDVWLVSEHEAQCRKAELIEDLSSWLERMKAFLRLQSHALDPAQRRTGQALRVHCHLVLAFLTVDGYMDEGCWDDLMPHFLAIISLASSLLEGDEQWHAQPRFSNHLGVIPALFLVGLKCRQPMVRRQALALLSAPRREGVWDSLFSAKIVERVIAQEEAGLEVFEASDLPLASRVRRTWVEQLPDGAKAAILHHQIVGVEGEPQVIIADPVAW